MSEFKGDELRVRTRRGGGVGRREYDHSLVSEIRGHADHGLSPPTIGTRDCGYLIAQFERRDWRKRRVT